MARIKNCNLLLLRVQTHKLCRCSVITSSFEMSDMSSRSVRCIASCMHVNRSSRERRKFNTFSKHCLEN